MSSDLTEAQDQPQRRRSRDLSLKRGQPPTSVPGYDVEHFLGGGAYGEVWVAVERNTGRRVAIKFYAHRGGLDWSLLSREVEKLAFLYADRYVVQLVGVGWDAEPPYYIMEYVERGSLAQRLADGPLPVDQAVRLFEETAIGLAHAHNKGVLHCDLKPANILLDQDDKPRLADFGQSRLSHEQAPALGTMFYMAPEQADLDAIPDARWDVYALGALLYSMLTGRPPYCSPEREEQFSDTGDLCERLAAYRKMIAEAPPPSEHRHVAGVDRLLAEIIDRCLAKSPERRFPNVQAVLEALRARAARRALRPLIVLGAIGPALLLAVVLWFAWLGFRTTLKQSDTALTARAVQSNAFAAQYVARTAANELERRFEAVERVSRSRSLRRLLAAARAKESFESLAQRLSVPGLAAVEAEQLAEEFRNHPDRKAIQELFDELIPDAMRPDGEEASSWFVCDARGISTVRVPEGSTIGRAFSWRSYFHGGLRDESPSWRPPPGHQLSKPHLSAVFRSQATGRWIVAISAPIYEDYEEDKGTNFLGVVAMTVEVGRLLALRQGERQFAALIDGRPGDHQGLVLQHPLYDRLLAEEGRVPDRFRGRCVEMDQLPLDPSAPSAAHYRDPLADDPDGEGFDRHWIAQAAPIVVRGEPSGWMVVVQEDHQAAIGETISRLRQQLIIHGIAAFALVITLLWGLWALAVRLTKPASRFPKPP